MSDKFSNEWKRREFLQGMGMAAAGMALSGCGISSKVRSADLSPLRSCGLKSALQTFNSKT